MRRGRASDYDDDKHFSDGYRDSISDDEDRGNLMQMALWLLVLW